jgi:hypothetical protein
MFENDHDEVTSLTMIEVKGNEFQRLAAVELKVLRWTKTGDRLEEKMQALRVGSVTNQLSESMPSFPANLGELRTGFRADIAAKSKKLRTEIAMLKSWTLAFPARELESRAFWDFPEIFEDFKGQTFTLLWRGTRDGFQAKEFHHRCDGHPNTLTVILDTDGNIFGGFTPVEWESSRKGKRKKDPEEPFDKADRSLESFILTLKNPHNFPPRRFTLKEEKKEEAIHCDSNCGPHFGDIMITDNCNANADSSTSNFGKSYTNDTTLAYEKSFFTGCSKFKVKEIEVFEVSPGGSEIGTLKMLELPTRKLESRAFWDFPAIFDEFREKKFSLLWRGSCDGFRAYDFHNRCDGHPNTLIVILDTGGNIFGGFTPVEWESDRKWKTDPSLKSFLFTLKNPHNVPARRFGLKAKQKDWTIGCFSDRGPHFLDIAIYDDCNTHTKSYTLLGDSYTNDTGLDGKMFLTGSDRFQVKEIEVFEISD